MLAEALLRGGRGGGRAGHALALSASNVYGGGGGDAMGSVLCLAVRVKSGLTEHAHGWGWWR